MFDETPKQSIKKDGSVPDLTRVDNTPTPMVELPKPKQALPKPPSDLSAFPPRKLGEVEDIFADVDQNSPKKMMQSNKKEKNGSGKASSVKPQMSVYIGFAALALIILVGGSWFVVSVLMPSKQVAPNIQVEQEIPVEIMDDQEEIAAEQQVEKLEEELMKNEEMMDSGVDIHLGDTKEMQEATTTEVVEEVVIDAVLKDTDNDGLTDGEEAEIGSNPILVDTDKDLLTDYEEVYVYFTDPIKEDTDDENSEEHDENNSDDNQEEDNKEKGGVDLCNVAASPVSEKNGPERLF